MHTICIQFLQSGYRGVERTSVKKVSGPRWTAAVHHGSRGKNRSRKYHVSTVFLTPEEAARAYDKAAVAILGPQLALTNFPLSEYGNEASTSVQSSSSINSQPPAKQYNQCELKRPPSCPQISLQYNSCFWDGTEYEAADSSNLLRDDTFPRNVCLSCRKCMARNPLRWQ